MELLGGGIFTTDGQEWLQHRKISSHMFSSGQLKRRMTDAFMTHSVLLAERIAKGIEEGSGVMKTDMQPMLFCFTFDSICAVAFGLDVHSMDNARDREFQQAYDDLNEIVSYRFKAPALLFKLKR